ncbi:MAG: IS21 family transposase [Dehalococcoides mccartyi]|uniref:IS21 family transposase n=1 Tax=Dehalococcoides mccartyi TaxID=61435 RepID=UPI0030FC7A74
MTEAHDIRHRYFEEGKSITGISRETGRDRKTIRMYIEKEDWNEAQSDSRPEAEFPKLVPYKGDIDAWLTEDKKAKRKQRHTARRVYDRLVEKYPAEFNCSYRTVAGYVAKSKREIYGKSAGYLPLEHTPGETQGDFGDAEFYEDGRLCQGKYLNLSFPWSNQGYLQLFKGENQECLFEGLIAIFEHIGGVPPEIWFDNTRTIVSKVMKGGGRTLTEDFLRFKEHYRFKAVFCNLEAGHEKGNVEGKVGYHRRNMLVPVPRFANLTEFNRELLKKCDEDGEREHYRKNDTIAALYVGDRAALLALPKAPLDVSKYVTVKTNGYGRFYLNNGLHEYSVSPRHADCRVLIRLTAGEVLPLDKDHRVIVRHPRLYGDYKQQSMEWLPYLTQLSRSPNALKYTGIYPMLPGSIKEYLERCNRSDRGKVLRLIATLTGESGFEKALETVGQALKYPVTDVDSLLNLHHRLYDRVFELPPLRLSESIPRLTRVTPDLAAYDACLEKAGVPRC